MQLKILMRHLTSLSVIGIVLLALMTPTVHSQAPQHIESDDAIVAREGNWTSQAASQASGSSYLYSSGAEADVLTLQFSGPSIEVIFVAGPSLGTLAINVDDIVLRTVITTAEQTAYQQSSRIDYLSDEPHTLKVYAQAGGVVGVDAFVVPVETGSGITHGNTSMTDQQSRQDPRVPCDLGEVMRIVSVSTAYTNGDYDSSNSAISADGRYIAFVSFATNLVPNDTHAGPDILLRDMETCQTTLVSVALDGGRGNAGSSEPSISADGRYIAFQSYATNLVPNDTNGQADVFVRDQLLGTTRRVSITPSGIQGNRESENPSLSATGRYVVFESWASSLEGYANSTEDVLLYDMQANTLEVVSLTSDERPGDQPSVQPSVSADGRFVVFMSLADFDPNSTFFTSDIFLRDRQLGTTTRISLSNTGGDPNNRSQEPRITPDGRYIVYHSLASNIAANDQNNGFDVFLFDRQTGTTTLVSAVASGASANNSSEFPSISDDGRFVVFGSSASNFVSGDTNYCQDAYLLDRSTNSIARLSVTISGGQQYNCGAVFPVISGQGRFVAFDSGGGLIPFDMNNVLDVYRIDIQTPLAPTLWAFRSGIGTIFLTWNDASFNESDFRVERSTDGINNWVQIGTVGANLGGYLDNGLPCGTTYYYRVRAYRAEYMIYSAYSNVANVTTSACPAVPTNLTATTLSQTSIRLNWIDNANDETNFGIERSPNGTSGWSQIGSTVTNVASFTDTVYLACGTTYYYRVRAYRASDTTYSGYSNVATATTSTCPLAAPSNLTAATLSQTSIRLTWVDNASDETNFGIERSPNGTSGWSQIGSTVANVASFTDTVYLACGTSYYYRVRSYRSGDAIFSAYSDITSANTAPCRPDALALVNPATRSANLIRTLDNSPAGSDAVQSSTGLPFGPGGQYVMGDWNGDGLDTIGVYREGAFYFTNDSGTGGTWGGIWFGLGGQPVVGRFDANVNHDCLGVTDSGTWTNGDTYFALYFTCNLTSGPTPPLTFQWLSILLPNSQGFTGTFQFVAGDFNGDGVDSVAVRRDAFIAWTNVPPTTLLSEFNLAQYIGAPGTGDEGKVVAGDWDMNNVDSFGLVYQNGTFYRRNDVEWNTGVYILQTFTSLVGTPFDVASWRPN